MNLLFFFRFCFHLHVVCGMFTKRTVPEDGEGHTGAKRLRAGLADVFLGNELSASKVGFLAKAAHDAGVGHLRDVAKAAGRGSKKNIHRNTLRAFLKRSKWPSLYHAPVRVWNLKEMREDVVQLAFQLPHELHRVFSLKNYVQTLACQEGMSTTTKQHVDKCAASLGLPPQTLIAYGLWGDGVPCNWDRSQAMDMFTLNMPGLPEASHELRLPIVALNKKFVLADGTFDDICTVIAWSFKQCALGTMPSVRHDGSAWHQTDAKRKRLAGKTFPRAILAEVRGDWSFYKQCFRFPQHNEVAGICFKCAATRSNYKDCSLTAPWRVQRLTHWQLIERMLLAGIAVSPLFDAPFLTTACFLLDWLHVFDLGVTPNFLGSMLLLIQKKYPGRNIALRCNAMYADLDQWYVDNDVESKLDQLTPSMLKPSKKPPHLRGKGAEIRAIVPWVCEAAKRLLLDGSPVEHTAKIAMEHLNNCYSCLSRDAFDSNLLQDNARKFSLLYVALAELNPLFHVVPKLHMVQEICEMSPSRPSTTWNYRDESFGGYLAQLSRLRGGSNNAVATGSTMIRKFQARHEVPSLA